MQQKSVRFAIIGTNFISDWVMAGARQDPRFIASAVFSRKMTTADAFAVKHGIPLRFTSVEELARCTEVDAVHRVGTVRHYFSSFCQYSSRYDRYKAGELLNAFNPELCQQSGINSWENSLIVMEIMDEIRAQIGVRYPADSVVSKISNGMSELYKSLTVPLLVQSYHYNIFSRR